MIEDHGLGISHTEMEIRIQQAASIEIMGLPHILKSIPGTLDVFLKEQNGYPSPTSMWISRMGW